MKATLDIPAAKGETTISNADAAHVEHHDPSLMFGDLPPHSAELQMRVLLRHKKTGRFFCAPDHWTNKSALARDFHTGWGATSVAVTMDAQNLAIYYDFHDERYDINIPVIPTPHKK
jgi:hypothetical protein